MHAASNAISGSLRFRSNETSPRFKDLVAEKREQFFQKNTPSQALLQVERWHTEGDNLLKAGKQYRPTYYMAPLLAKWEQTAEEKYRSAQILSTALSQQLRDEAAHPDNLAKRPYVSHLTNLAHPDSDLLKKPERLRSLFMLRSDVRPLLALKAYYEGLTPGYHMPKQQLNGIVQRIGTDLDLIFKVVTRWHND